MSAKVIMFALLPLVSLQLSSFAGAVNIIFYEDTNKCEIGLAKGCYTVNPYVCCSTNTTQAVSVLIDKADDGVLSRVFVDGGCSTFVGTGPGRSRICYDSTNLPAGREFTGAYWYGHTRRSLLADPTSCDTRMEHNSVIFTEDSTKGHWILTTPYVDQLYSEVQTMPNAEKANWLKSRGAVYDRF